MPPVLTLFKIKCTYMFLLCFAVLTVSLDFIDYPKSCECNDSADPGVSSQTFSVVSLLQTYQPNIWFAWSTSRLLI